MINKQMSDYKSKNEETSGKLPEKKPNENAGFYFSSSVKIFDPNSQQILVQKRGDD
jgi:hypothetical protein